MVFLDDEARHSRLLCPTGASRTRYRHHPLPAAPARQGEAAARGLAVREVPGEAAARERAARRYRFLLREPALGARDAHYVAALDRRLPRRLGAAAARRLRRRLCPPGLGR